MANDRRETHWWSDGEAQFVYTERPADARRFEAWFGPATTVGRVGGVPRSWKWDGLAKDAMRLRRRVRRVHPASESVLAKQKLNLERAREAQRSTRGVAAEKPL